MSALTYPKKYNSVQRWEEKVPGGEPGALQQACHRGAAENGFSSCAVVCDACPWKLKPRTFNNIIISAGRRTGSAISLPGLFTGLRQMQKNYYLVKSPG